MRKPLTLLLLATLLGTTALISTGAHASDDLQAGFGVRTVTPHGPSPAGWDFWVNPQTGVWGEEFTDQNANKYYDPGEPFVDDVRNTLLDPQSAGKWDGCWTNAGFSGRGALGKYDDVWARAVVLAAGGKKVAIVSLDAVGLFYEEIVRIREELDKEYAGHGVDLVIVSSTHTHESCDTMGYWGNPVVVHDGKFPLWQSYIRSQIVDAIAEANAELEPARMKAATTEHLAGVRDSRPPDVKDPYLQAAQFIRPSDGTPIGTMVNWSNHPEALASGNRYISSDFPHGTRTKLEAVTGAPAIYFSGSVGGLMTPLGVDMGPPYGTAATTQRAYYIGELVADAALGALQTAPVEAVSSLDFARREVFMQSDNTALRALNVLGIFDKPTYRNGIYAERTGDQFKTEIATVGAGSMRIQTVPGELFPEIEIGGYGRPDCPAADTGRPYEPVIRDQFENKHLFVLGLAQDELGYIVPGYDFWADGPRATAVTGRPARPPVSGFGQLLDDARDVDDEVENATGVRPGLSQHVDSRDPCGRGHYEESVSASSAMAPVVACTIAELAGKDPWANLEDYPACSKQNTTTGIEGTHPEG